METLAKDALLVATRQELIDQVLALQERMQSQASKMEELEFQLHYLKRELFGAKSERFIPASDLQIALDLGIGPNADSEIKTETISYDRRKTTGKEKKPGHGRGGMPTHLPIVKKTIEPDEDVTDLTRIGEEVSWYYEMKPASLYVVQITRPKYGLAKGEGVVCGKLPVLPTEKGNAGPGFMAQVTAINLFTTCR